MELAAIDDDAMDLERLGFGSDGSDYEVEDASSVYSSSNSEDDEDSLSFMEPEQFFADPDPPAPPRHDNISLEELHQLLQEHRKNRTVKKCLTEIDTTDSGMFLPNYDKPTELFEAPQLKGKTYGTILHFACHDQDGPRGEEKIRAILKEAARVGVDFTEMLSLGEVPHRLERTREGHEEWTTDITDRAMTPIRILLYNSQSTVGSVQLLCNAWPAVVHFRDVRLDSESTTLTDILYGYGDDTEAAEWRRVAIVEALLETADKTREGAKGLVSASQRVRIGLDSEDLGAYYPLKEEQTAFHIVTTYQSKPELFLPLLLQAWPEALKYCNECTESCGSFPLHNVASDRHGRHYESKMKSIEAFFRGSTMEALATAFLRTNSSGELGFHVVQKAIEDTDSSGDKELQAYMQGIMKELVYQKDKAGRTLLHYIAASQSEFSEREFRSNKFHVIKKHQEENGEPFDWSSFDWERDPSDAEVDLLEKERDRLKKRNAGYIADVCRWILGVDVSLAFVRDNDGMNPFHFAMSRGMQWGTGLENLAAIVSLWPHSREGANGLFPFMLAASLESSPDIDTTYELLRFVGSVHP